ncbi:MAG: hypothetical protein KF779_06960 [Hyphomonadaceae bacterium]|nr:hypothetical protein [Hyphomonadaceae bacterium]
MVAITPEALQPEQPSKNIAIDWALVACVFGAILSTAASLSAVGHEYLKPYISRQNLELAQYPIFAFAVLLPVAACWLRAIADGQLPARRGLEPQYEHVSGWSAVFLVLVMAIIALLVLWAAGSVAANRKIHAEWGTWVVIGLSIAFVAVASAPVIPRVIRIAGLESTATKASKFVGAPVEWIGKALSALDSVLVFAVANAVGTNRSNFFVRYTILIASITACAVLGYYWSPVAAFAPIACGFIISFSVSRRWGWIESDRELAMLNPSLSKSHIRVGFAQNLRDEALIVFLSMFLLVPLALRQGEILALNNHIELFDLSDNVDVHSLSLWLAFYGTELAKAVPFVDWAEVYHVEGDAPVQATAPLALHTVFAVRVLIDLVFLAALLQAISSAARDAQQRDLFYRKRAIRYLDPFTEPEAFRALVKRNADGDWVPNGERFEDFPPYDPDRLVELSASRDERIKRAADFLFDRDGNARDPHHRLSLEAAKRGVTPDEISEILNDIENAGADRNVYQLSLARRRLLGRRAMADVRRRIVGLIVQNREPVDRGDRRNALLDAMVGEHREGYAQARRVALDALAPEIGIDLAIRKAIEQVADQDTSEVLKKHAKTVLREHPETPD